MQWFAFCAFVAGLNLLAPACVAQQHICDTHQTVVPGEAIGGLNLGAPVEAAIQLLGKPEMPERIGDVSGSNWRILYYFPESDVHVYASGGKIVDLVLGSGTTDVFKCATAEGIRIGTRMTANVRKAFGDPDGKIDIKVVAWWIYAKRGIMLTVNPQGDVMGMEIFAPGTFCTVAGADNALGGHNLDCRNFKPPLVS